MHDVSTSFENCDFVVLKNIEHFCIDVDSKTGVLFFESLNEALEYSDCNTELFFQSYVVVVNFSSGNSQVH